MPKGIYKRTPEMKTGKYERTPEHSTALSKAKTGIPLSPEHIAVIKKGCKESDAVKAKAEKQRGGNDLVTHHHIYDHNDLSKYTIEMTRSQHSKLHVYMKVLGLGVPHINTGHETEDELKLMEYIKKIESEPKGDEAAVELFDEYPIIEFDDQAILVIR